MLFAKRRRIRMIISPSLGLSSCPVILQGNTQISHHPASPFAPIARTTPTATITGGVRTVSPSSVRSHSDVTASAPSHLPHVQHLQRTITASPPPQPTEYQRVLCNSGAGPGPRPVPDDGELFPYIKIRTTFPDP